MPADIEEPKYITIYHAIDWLSGIVASPSPIFMHEKIASQKNISQMASALLIELNSRIQSGELIVYGKQFPAIFSQQSTNNPNQPNISLDYPDYEINWNTSKLTLLPKIDIDEDELLDFRRPIYSPAKFLTIKASRELEKEISWLLFSFNHLKKEFRNFYGLEKHGLTIWDGHNEDIFPKDATIALLFFKVAELRKIFPKQLNHKKTGNPTRHFPEFSLLAFLNMRKDEISDADRYLIQKYLDDISFQKFQADFDKAGAKIKHLLISDLYEDQEVLPAILNDLIAYGLDMEKILDVTHIDFFYLVSKRYGSERTLQNHFVDIKSRLAKLKRGKKI